MTSDDIGRRSLGELEWPSRRSSEVLVPLMGIHQNPRFRGSNSPFSFHIDALSGSVINLTRPKHVHHSGKQQQQDADT